MATCEERNPVDRVARNYSDSAEGYAEFWSPLIRPVGCRLLEVLPWRHACRVLDVGTGTGALVPDIRRFAPGAQVVGIDCSPGMLALAAGRGAELAAMDAMRLGLATHQFDVAVMAFVLFHMPEPSVALAEVKRVLRPGATFGLVTWAEDPEPPAGVMWANELAAAGPCDPTPHPERRHDVMNTPDKVTELLESAGFAAGR